jgi:hypothetical protein
MRKGLLILFVLLVSLNTFAQSIQSPDGKLSLSFGLSANGEPTYELSFAGRPVLKKSRLGIELKELPAFTSLRLSKPTNHVLMKPGHRYGEKKNRFAIITENSQSRSSKCQLRTER